MNTMDQVKYLRSAIASLESGDMRIGKILTDGRLDDQTQAEFVDHLKKLCEDYERLKSAAAR